MRWKPKHKVAKPPKTTWHEWFAWHPVKTEGGIWVWLEQVQRRLHRQFGNNPEFDSRTWLYHLLS